MNKQSMDNLFLQEKPTLALMAVWAHKRTYASVVTKEINSTFAHTTKILSKMEEMGLVKFTVDGRIKYVELTEYGIEAVEALQQLIHALKDTLPSAYLKAVEADENVVKHALNEESEKILGKIRELRTKIDKSYTELVKSKASDEAIKRKLGPFSREVALVGTMIENSEEPIHDDVLIAYDETADAFNSIIKRN
ncbi:DNA-binding MarR family transcriptional regulator [Methanohalophilus levihalophilus]|uniref:MarR family transcriptional regulator n=1 Tax=Methanohalophilus levihalophilus TaxID=1431282 RepID=UPI001AE34D27|nr:MarR family transcriptional regulator [Methanohalophilus levihalophilus]MBP2029675.1 DNA-binding MarR family transcriptional regulator [Methanohalophilus levihalophilus]